LLWFQFSSFNNKFKIQSLHITTILDFFSYGHGNYVPMIMREHKKKT